MKPTITQALRGALISGVIALVLNQIWNFDFDGQTRIVDVHISHLREKIETNPKNPQYLLTIRGFGYKFQEPSNG